MFPSSISASKIFFACSVFPFFFNRNPGISGQHQAYAIKEIQDFKSGARANDKGRVMRVVAERLTDAEIKAVTEYMAGL